MGGLDVVVTELTWILNDTSLQLKMGSRQSAVVKTKLLEIAKGLGKPKHVKLIEFVKW